MTLAVADASSGTSAQDLLISLNQTLPIATFLSVLDQTDLLGNLVFHLKSKCFKPVCSLSEAGHNIMDTISPTHFALRKVKSLV